VPTEILTGSIGTNKEVGEEWEDKIVSVERLFRLIMFMLCFYVSVNTLGIFGFRCAPITYVYFQLAGHTCIFDSWKEFIVNSGNYDFDPKRLAT
jgi:hypothetical protein